MCDIANHSLAATATAANNYIRVGCRPDTVSGDGPMEIGQRPACVNHFLASISQRDLDCHGIAWPAHPKMMDFCREISFAGMYYPQRPYEKDNRNKLNGLVIEYIYSAIIILILCFR